MVNPKTSFRRVAERRGWDVVEWHERTKGALPTEDSADEWGSWDG